MTASRQPAGTPTGGQFAPSAQPRAQLTLVTDPVDATPGAVGTETDAATRLSRMFDVADALSEQADHEQAVAQARDLLPHLDQTSFEAHVAAISEAAQAARRFEDDEDAAYQLPAGSPLWGEVDLDDYAGSDDDGGLGYDFGEATRALAAHWDATRFARVQAACRADDAAGIGRIKASA